MHQKRIFEKFIVTDSNRDAYCACLAAVKNDGIGRFIALYGPVSCGKTHLLYAIKDAFERQHPDDRASMISADSMMKEYIEALKQDAALEYKMSLYEKDLLIIDNMQSLTKMGTLQEEMTQWFLDMLNQGKTVVIALGKYEWSFQALLSAVEEQYPNESYIVEIKAPDMVLREEFLKQRMGSLKVALSDDIIKHIVDNHEISLAAMEGLLLRFRMMEESDLSEKEMIAYLEEYDRELSLYKIFR